MYAGWAAHADSEPMLFELRAALVDLDLLGTSHLLSGCRYVGKHWLACFFLDCCLKFDALNDGRILGR